MASLTIKRADRLIGMTVLGTLLLVWLVLTGFDALTQFVRQLGNIGKNTIFGPGLQNWDFSLFKNTKLTERVNLQLRAEFFNVLNHPNFGIPNSNISNPSQVGRITSTSNTPRDIQFGARLSF